MKLFSAGILIALFSLNVNAATEVKIGTVDMNKAIQTVEAGKKARSDLEKEFNKKKADFQKEEGELKKMHEEFQKQSMALSDQARAKKQEELQQRVMKLQQEMAQSQASLQQKEAQLTEPIVVKMKSVIEDIAKKKGYTVVLEKGGNAVLFSPDSDDITKEVVETFNNKKN